MLPKYLQPQETAMRVSWRPLGSAPVGLTLSYWFARPGAVTPTMATCAHFLGACQIFCCATALLCACHNLVCVIQSAQWFRRQCASCRLQVRNPLCGWCSSVSE